MRRSTVLRGAAALALASRAGTAQAQTPAPLPISIAAPPSDDATPFYYALSAGLFPRAGLDVTFQPLGSGSAVAQAVAGGAVQIGLSSLLPIVLAHVKAVPFAIVAPAGIYLDSAPYAAMVVRSDAPIHTGSDMNGKMIGVAALKDTGGMASMAWIEQNGGNPQLVRQIETPYSLQVAALQDGRIDAISLIQPGLGQALASGTLRILGKSYSAIAKRFMITAWFARTDYIAANTEAVRRFARVMHDASVYANGHHDDTAPLLSAATKVDIATIRQSTRETYAESLDPADIQRLVDAAAKYKAIDAGFDARDLVSPAVANLR
jgi:NitT/TauT family transport system substrate-binding protein